MIVIICVAVSTFAKRGEADAQNGGAASETTKVSPSPPVIPTVAPVSTSALPPASEKNNMLDILHDLGQTKRVYLTFDDGPTGNITPQVLDVLRRYNVKATFFEVGSLIKANPDAARRVYEEGHLIANHSNGHNYEKLYASEEAFINEINECYENIKAVTGEAEPFKLVRFPGGSYDSDGDKYSSVKQQCKETLKQYGFYYCDWNASSGDADGKMKDARQLLDFMTVNIYDDNNVVVLMHDASTKQTTVDALPMIIQYFIDNGYTFHRLDDIGYQSDSSSSNTAAGSPAPTAAPSASPSVSAAPSASAMPSASVSPSASPSGSSANDNGDGNLSATVSPAVTAAPRPTMPPENQGGPIIIN